MYTFSACAKHSARMVSKHTCKPSAAPVIAFQQVKADAASLDCDIVAACLAGCSGRLYRLALWLPSAGIAACGATVAGLESLLAVAPGSLVAWVSQAADS